MSLRTFNRIIKNRIFRTGLLLLIVWIVFYSYATSLYGTQSGV